MAVEPFLAVKNWEKYQTCKTGRSSGWVKDYTDKDASDPDYSRLRMNQRYMMDACCRLRGRIGKNLTNDPLWICRATGVIPQERHNAVAAILELIRNGFLIPTNQQVNFPESAREEERRGEKRRREKKKTCAETSSAPPFLTFPLNDGTEHPVLESDVGEWVKLFPAVDVKQELRNMRAWLLATPEKRKTDRGVNRFIVSWLKRTQDNPKAAAQFAATVPQTKPVTGESFDKEMAAQLGKDYAKGKVN